MEICLDKARGRAGAPELLEVARFIGMEPWPFSAEGPPAPAVCVGEAIPSLVTPAAVDEALPEDPAAAAAAAIAAC